MNANKTTLCFASIMVLFVACKDQSPTVYAPSSSQSTSDCISSGLNKNERGTYADSIFTYSFHASMLDLNFSVIASCGLHSSGFIVQETLHEDTIDVCVVDTNRATALCSCVYIVTVSNIPVTQDEYRVRCTFLGSADSISYLLHTADVNRYTRWP